MNRKWFDFIALLILATIIANMSWYRGLASPENFASIAVYTIIALALRTFLYTSKGNPLNIGDKPKKILGLIFKLSIVIAIIFGIFIYVYNTDEYFKYKAEYFFGKSIVLDCNSSEGYLGSIKPRKGLFMVVKPIDRGMRLLQIEENTTRPFNIQREISSEHMVVSFTRDWYFDRSNLDIKKHPKKFLINHYKCKEVDRQVFDKKVKSFYNNKKRVIKF